MSIKPAGTLALDLAAADFTQVDLSKAIQSAARAAKTEADKRGVMLDMFQALGWTPEVFKAPAKGEDRTRFDFLKGEAIQAFFTADQRKLMAADPKTLSDEDKKTRRALIQQPNARVGKWGKYLAERLAQAKRLETNGKEGTERAANHTAPLEDRLLRDVLAWKARLQKAEGSVLPITRLIAKFEELEKLAKERV